MRLPKSQSVRVVLLSFLLVVGLFVGIAISHAQKVNTDYSRTDQGAYLNTAWSVVAHQGWNLGGRNRMPIYPYILSLVYSPNISRDKFFIRGKYLNIVFSLVLGMIIYLINLKNMSTELSAVLALTILFIYKVSCLKFIDRRISVGN